eukprot:COSAG06_NODE_32952_length_497_cov_1.560302_2_plen_28_part_01
MTGYKADGETVTNIMRILKWLKEENAPV